MDRYKEEIKLKKIFNINRFYDEQWIAINKLLNKKRVLVVQKTGFGKSLCYQFPAVILPNMTVVFSPLLSLMRDQINKLNELGIPAAAINSEQENEENEEIIQNAKNGELKLLYIAPERQENSSWLESVKQMKISMVVIDEAHCISTWGHDFRPAFRRIIDIVKLLPMDIPVIATTATATNRVVNDILEQIPGNVELIRGNLTRDNFKLNIINVSEDDAKLTCTSDIVRNENGFGIIYTGTRSDTDKIADFLNLEGVSCTPYHAGKDKESRKSKELGMMNNQWRCMTATNALGMGVDKKDITFIIHTQMPQSPIHYYQEIGRAGRDNRPVNIYLLYNESDKKLPLHFINNARPDKNKYDKVIEALIKKPLGQHNIMRYTGLKQTPVNVIINDLLDQNIIIKTEEKKKTIFEYRYGANSIDYGLFEEYRKYNLEQLNRMIEYIGTNECRMKYLCEYLDDTDVKNCGKCNNCRNENFIYKFDEKKQERVKLFYRKFHPMIQLVTEKENQKPIDQRKVKLLNGIAFSYYGTSKVGKIVHNCKYENGGDFPDIIIKGMCDTFMSFYRDEEVDFIMYVPPTESGDLVKNLAIQIGKRLNIPVNHNLIKLITTKPQKEFENSILKKDNLRDVFHVNSSEEIQGKNILLIDDVCDSKATLKEIGKLLSKLNVNKILPLVIAKTVGGEEV